MDGENNKQPSSAPERKRGRPPGHNRPALTDEERRARNAQYERERRAEQANASAELAREMGCESNIRLAELLALAILRFRNEHPIDLLQSQNEAIEVEIARLRSELGSDYNSEEEEDSEEVDLHYIPYEEYHLHDDEFNEPMSSRHPAKRSRCDNEEELAKNDLASFGPQAKRPKWDNGSGSSEEPQPSTSCFDTFLYLTTPPNKVVASLDQVSGSPASTMPAETATTESPTDEISLFSVTEEEEDLLLSPEDLTTLGAMLQNDVLNDGIPFWMSIEDLDFQVFPPT
ncbi:hypothetical protein evm_014517 [Chilo suppressalis]|nr:hypothetical protein evm_014517 [Chilo suppressalis]